MAIVSNKISVSPATHWPGEKGHCWQWHDSGSDGGALVLFCWAGREFYEGRREFAGFVVSLFWLGFFLGKISVEDFSVFSYPKALGNTWKFLKDTFSKGRCQMKNWPLEVFLGKFLQILVKHVCLRFLGGSSQTQQYPTLTCFRNLSNNFRHSLHPFLANSFKGEFWFSYRSRVYKLQALCQKKQKKIPYISESLLKFCFTFPSLPSETSKTQNPKPNWLNLQPLVGSHPSIHPSIHPSALESTSRNFQPQTQPIAFTSIKNFQNPKPNW